MRRNTTRNLSVLLIPLAALTFAVSSPATVVALRNASVALVVAGRCGVAALALLAILALLRPSGRPRLNRRQLGVAMGSGIILSLHFMFFVAGLAHTSFAAAVAIISLEPIAVLAAGALFFGDRPSALQLVGTGLAIAGTVVVGGAFSANAVGHQLTGDVMELGAVALFGSYYALNRAIAAKGAAGPSSVALSSATVIYASATLAALSFAVASGAPLAWPTREALVAIVTLGIVPTLIGHTASQAAARALAPALVALVPPGETLGSLAIGVFALSLRPARAELVGATLIVLGVLTVAFGTASLTRDGENLHQGRG